MQSLVSLYCMIQDTQTSLQLCIRCIMLWCQVVGVIFDCYQCSGNCPLMISSNLSSVFHKQILVQLLANSCHISRDGKYRNFYRNFLKTSTFYIYIIYIYISSICTTDFKELWINMGSTEMQREIWDRPWKLSGRGCSRFFSYRSLSCRVSSIDRHIFNIRHYGPLSHLCKAKFQLPNLISFRERYQQLNMGMLIAHRPTLT